MTTETNRPRAVQIRDIYALLKIGMPDDGDTVLFKLLEEFKEYHTNVGYEEGYEAAYQDNDWYSSSC